MKKKLFSLLIVFALAMMVVAPALAAATWDLNIHNNTEDGVKINLTGPKNYSFTIDPGKWQKTVQEGDYKYSYTACGQKFSGTVTVKDDLQWITIDSCAAAAVYAKLAVDSHLGQSITLTLTGPQTYALTISLGTNVFLSLQSGFYTYSYDACGTTLNGEMRLTKNGKTRLTIYACEQLANHPLTPASGHSPTNLRIASHYSFPIRITLIGPANYSFELLTGMNRFEVQKGDYKYFYTAYGVTKSGTFTVSGGGATIIASPVKP